MQNNSSWYGDHISSAILSCNIGTDEASDRMRKLSRYLEKRPGKPVRWSDVMKRASLFEESYRDEQAGDLVRDDCKIIANMEMDGGFVFGGADGMKYLTKPKIDSQVNEDETSRWSKPVIAMTCDYGNGYKCSTTTGHDTTEHLMKMQKTVQDLFLNAELKKWNKETSKKAKEVAVEIEKLIDDKGMNFDIKDMIAKK